MDAVMRRRASILASLVLIAGLWLMASAFVLPPPEGIQPLASAAVLGLVVALIAAIQAFQPTEVTWLGWIDGIIGVWIIASPWSLHFASSSVLVWNSVLTGLVIAVLSFWSAALGQQLHWPLGGRPQH